MKKVRRFLSLLLIVCMIVTFAPAAFADDPTAEAEAGTTKDDTNPAEVKVDGDVDNAKAEAKNGGEASFEVGSITDTDGYTAVQVEASATSAQTSENATIAEGTVAGDVSASTSADTVTGAEVKADNNGSSQDVKATLTVDGGISASTDAPSSPATGAAVKAENTGSAQTVEAVLMAGGDISATSQGAYAANANGLTVEAAGDNDSTATAKADVGGNITASGDNHLVDDGVNGIKATAKNNGSVDIEVGGTVTATATSAQVTSVAVQGVDAIAESNGTIEIDVGGVVTAKSEVDTVSAQGVSAQAVGENAEVNAEVEGIVTEGGKDSTKTVGAELYAGNEGAVTLTVGEKGINVSGGEGTVGAALDISDESTVNFKSYGDVKAEGNESVGIDLQGYTTSSTELGDINVFVDGTVSGEKASINLTSSELKENDVSVTVWEAKVVDDKVVAVDAGAGEEREKTAAAIEANIQYIIRAEQEGNGAHNDYTGLSVSGATQVNGYYAATEETDVTLKAFEGYRIVSMEGSNDATKSVLTQDSDGVYHILIPKGGGMWINVKMEKIEPAPAPAPEPAASDGGGYEYAVYALGTITAGDGSILTIYNTRNYTVDYADGAKEKGTYQFVYDGQFLPDGSGEKGAYRWLNDGLLIFTSFEQEVRTPEVDEESGDATYTFRNHTEFLIESEIVSMIRSGRKFADLHISQK